jgi:aromatic ring-opening dioxygenase LigB subunit
MAAMTVQAALAVNVPDGSARALGLVLDQVQMANIVERGIQELIALDAGKRRAARPAGRRTVLVHAGVLESDRGKQPYAKRRA